ncbi:MAG TPA: cobalt ECF transporter T component CbiQ [Acidimicrobiales bacterium]|jgi:cobalt/nickel transport system permease protein|nr:cobalt ECF transporter T component CbiQ [Acidimicrobiales bacterium]
MSGGHTHASGLHHAGDTAVHRLPAEAKVAATVVAVLAIVATPRDQVWAFAAHAVVLLLVVAAMGLPPRALLRRLRIEVPFLVFAVLLPVVGRGPRVDVLGLSLSHEGLWAGWNIAAKGTLGVLAAIILSSSTPVAELLRGVERLKAPRMLVAITGFMVRYLDVVVGEASRMRIARVSRGDDPRWIWQARATAATGGTLFVRSYERGERVHLAMLARGYEGSMPEVHHHHAAPRAHLLAAVVPAVHVAIAVAALVR